MAVIGCEAKAEKILVRRVLLDAPREFDGQADEREAIRTEISKRLRNAQRIRLEPGTDEATHRAHVRIGEVVETPLGQRLRPVQLTLRPRAKQAEFEATGLGSPDGDRSASVLEAFDDALGIIQRQRTLYARGVEALVGALDEQDARLRDFAISSLGELRAKEAVAPLCERLKTEEKSDLVLRAIGALVAIGDAKAVEPIIDLSHRKDPQLVMQVVFAVGAIGGRTAEAFLVTMASGHPIAPIRKAAEDALNEMREKSPKP